MIPDYYQTLECDSQATPEEIKQAYRRLVKRYHPDSQLESADSETTIRLNAAYEVLSDPQRRRSYDRREYQGTANPTVTREQRTASAQQQYQQQRQSEQGSDRQQKQWQKQVYIPIKRLIAKILSPLTAQIDQLAADPFDDDLLAAFDDYLATCREWLEQARRILASQPNPATQAGTAAHLYYCLNQIGDGIDELAYFSLNYDDRHLHTGQELFRIARRLYQEAQERAQILIF
ncbi:MAG: J domain-containing protein [Chloroflexaceae bacterium]|nr:J domain-containing protein [Chloroflexaceae bacterium]